MGIRELQRRATPKLLASYKRQLPCIRDPRQFQALLRRARIVAAVLETDLAEFFDALRPPALR